MGAVSTMQPQGGYTQISVGPHRVAPQATPASAAFPLPPVPLGNEASPGPVFPICVVVLSHDASAHDSAATRTTSRIETGVARHAAERQPRFEPVRAARAVSPPRATASEPPKNTRSCTVRPA